MACALKGGLTKSYQRGVSGMLIIALLTLLVHAARLALAYMAYKNPKK